MSVRSRFGSLVVVCGLLGTLGCGNTNRAQSTQTVTGLVTFKGQALPDGEIVFVGEDGKASDPAKVHDGRYETVLTPGNKRVRIRAARVKEGGARDAMGAAVAEDYLPAAYNTETTLRAEVVSGGPNVFNFTLEEK
ncbi:MAG: hypothetical protein C0467_11215 [Planctomycetaceae bacterium]|nr:hypothetical protein [Planctomycetaceae bacterium]